MQQIEAAGAVVANRLTKNLTLLGSIGSIAPLLGLLGTVVGMIEIFASQQAGSNPQELARGISMALYCTALGIIVAVPAVLAYRYFSRLVDDYLVNMEEQAERCSKRSSPTARPNEPSELMRFRRAFDEEPELNLMPLIDVMLIVLIFLAVSTTYSRFAELQITLPSADARSPRTAERDQRRRHRGGPVCDRAATARIERCAPFAEALRVRSRNQGKAGQSTDQHDVLIINADAQAPTRR